MLSKCVIVIASYFLISTANAKTCNTPDNKLGECIKIKICPTLFSLLEKKQMTDDDVELLKKSQCGYEDDQPTVCCPIDTEKQDTNLLPDASICGLDPNQRIVGGQLTNLGEFPWLAVLEYQTPKGQGFHCGGSLINDRYVLTAAHCIKRIPLGWTLIGLRLGEHDLSKERDCEEDEPGFENCSDDPIDFKIEKIIIHEGYKAKAAGQPHDIALLRLNKPVTYSEYIGPICLPIIEELKDNQFSGIDLTVAGWGRTENQSQSEVKLKVQVPVKSNSYCKSVYSSVDLLSSQLCAGGERGKDSCTGDSGGPLMHLYKGDEKYNWYLGGIVSFGPTFCGTEKAPGIYTRVTSYMPWIIANLEP